MALTFHSCVGQRERPIAFACEEWQALKNSSIRCVAIIFHRWGVNFPGLHLIHLLRFQLTAMVGHRFRVFLSPTVLFLCETATTGFFLTPPWISESCIAPQKVLPYSGLASYLACPSLLHIPHYIFCYCNVGDFYSNDCRGIKKLDTKKISK